MKKKFVEQFTIDQYNYQHLFTKILSIFLTVLVGYGYVFTNGYNFDLNESNTTLPKVEPEILFYAFAISILILNFGILLICSLAQGFRRDQFVVQKIRLDAGLGQVFPNTFCPKVSISNKDQE